jgi:plasmid stabilization system protein ParE
MTLRLNILPRAQQDVQKIFDWIAERSPDGANRWFAAFEQATQKLLINPEIYGAAPENKYVACELKQFLFKTRQGGVYRGLFTLIDDEVRVLRIRGPGQPPLATDELDVSQ